MSVTRQYHYFINSQRGITMAKNLGRAFNPRTFERTAPQAGIHDALCFSALIRHERCRADRSGKIFTLVAFTFNEEGLSPSHIKRSCDRLAKAMRSIDEIGRLDDGRIGVLLPATTLEGAHQYARRASAGEKGVSYKVYIYPDHWISDYSEKEEAEEAASPDVPALGAVEKVPLWKRCLDVVGATFGLLVLWPLFLVVAAYIKIVSPGPAFFTQKRVGRGGKLFTFVKFRTMKFGNDQGTHQEHIIRRIRAGQALAKLDDVDSRIIPGGKMLRKACVDELPQLFNVLRGDMSLVGPRPCVPYEAREFLMWHTHRFDALPGMTGLWQVSGKNKLTFAQMIRLDIAYAARMSLWNDIKILARTFPAIVVMVVESVAGKLNKKEALPSEPFISEPIQKEALL
jgi:lipopolysaccharide/colanic/teichoic acid biosynthesis glycosyltransferase